MDRDFWHQKWEKNEIGFHGSEANPLLVKYFNWLSLAKGSRVFLPLCGKTLDIHWLLAQGYRVAGAELIKIAIGQLFKELGIEPKIEKVGELDRYSAQNIDIFVGDIFQLDAKLLGPVEAVYDRAALVALPPDMRDRYTAHLIELTNRAPQLLLCFEYDQSRAAGPPFSISQEEVRRHYQKDYGLDLLARVPVAGGLRGQVPAQEDVWLLKKEPI